jgi:hypothetical protein
LATAIVFVLPALAPADGGTIRLAQRCGNYQITVFTSPTPVRAGPVDISVLLQDASTGEPVSGAQVKITAAMRGSDTVISHMATTEAATNKLYYAAGLDLPEAGDYTVDVSVAGVREVSCIQFDLNVSEPLPQWLALWPWFGWPALVIALFFMNLWFTKRRGEAG